MSSPDSTGYERRDFNSRLILRAALWLLAALFASFVIVKLFADYMGGGSPGAHRTEPPHGDMAGPRLQANPSVDLARFRATEEERLHSYGWVDRQAGIIHMPIERAMELTAQRGLPAREPQKKGGGQ